MVTILDLNGPESYTQGDVQKHPDTRLKLWKNGNHKVFIHKVVDEYVDNY